jgi:coenzyme F420-0:L-glutamate ligase / coenzyme F420-1:gamma-L-glutamate ligase
VELYPLPSRLVEPGTSLVPALQDSLSNARIRLRNRDIIAVASKVVAVSEGRIRPLSEVKPSKRAIILGRQYSLSPDFSQVVLDESDQVYGGVKGALLTLKDGQATANAGVDRKNAPEGMVVLWPENPKASAVKLRRALKRRTGLDLGIVIIDSRVTPLRLGTIGLSLASIGFKPVSDFRGEPDLFGRPARITLQAMGDGIAAAAHLLMGEAREAVPFVLVRNAPVVFGGQGPDEKMAVRDCLYMSQIARSSSGRRR